MYWKDGARKLRQDAGCRCPAELAYPWVDLAFGLERGALEIRSRTARVSLSGSRKRGNGVDKGKLGERSCTMIDEVWAEIEAVAPLDVWNK